MIKSYKRSILGISFILIIAYYFCLPSVLFNTPYSTIVNARDGSLLSAHIADDGQWRFPETSDVPEKFEHALLCFEDEYFYQHPGVNPVSLGRAFIQNIKAGQIKSGGSTITMQVIRLAFNRKRTLFNKLIESIQATRLECRYKKKEILQIYASHAPFGGNVVGIDAAAWRYFGCPARQLSWAESALLAVLPNAPSLMHPGKNRKQLRNKRDFLLQKLFDKGLIDSTEHYLACAEPLPSAPLALPRMAPHLLTTLSANSTKKQFNTSLDKQLQMAASQIAHNFYSINRHNEIHNLAAIILDNSNGKVLAYVGNAGSKGHAHDVDIIRSRRSTGSTLKPFLYAGALNDGLILPEMLLEDVPTYYNDFSPKNYNKQYDGAVPANTALSRSLNVPFVKLQHAFGNEKFLDLLHKIGFKTFNNAASHYGLSLILGGGETSLWELAGAYSSMARCLIHYTSSNGYYRQDEFRAPDISQDTLSPTQKESFQSQTLGAGAIYHTLEALTNVQRPEEETGWENFSTGRKIAWKTGTSFGFRDAWAVGVTPEYTVGVWVGNATGEGRPGIIGGVAAAPIMFELFRQLPNTAWFDVPYDDLQPVLVCKESGYKASSHCHHVDTMYLPDVANDLPVCPYHRLVHLNKEKTRQVNADCYPFAEIQHESWLVLPPVMAWYYQSKNPSYRALPPYLDGCNNESYRPIALIYPQPKAQLYVPKEMDGSLGSIVCKATHREANAQLFWYLDNHFLGSTYQIHQMSIQPDKGKHYLLITDKQGNTLSQSFTCMGKGGI